MRKFPLFRVRTAVFYTFLIAVLQVLLAFIVVFILILYQYLKTKKMDTEAVTRMFMTSEVLIPVILVSELTMLLIAFRVRNKYALVKSPVIQMSNLKPVYLILTALLGLFYFFPASGIEYFIHGLIKKGSVSLNFVDIVARNSSQFGIPIAIFTLAVVPAFCEEFLFRRNVQRYLTLRHGFIGGLLTTSLIFASLHISIPGFIPIFILSVLMGYVYHKTDNVLYPMLIHFIYNSAGVLYTRFPVLKKAAIFQLGKMEPVQMAVFAGTTAVCAGLIAALVLLRFRSIGTKPADTDQTKADETLRIARDVVDRKIRPLTGAGLMYMNLASLRLEGDERFFLLGKIADEAGVLMPGENERAGMDKKALRKADKKAAKFEKRVRPNIINAAKTLVKLLENTAG